MSPYLLFYKNYFFIWLFLFLAKTTINVRDRIILIANPINLNNRIKRNFPHNNSSHIRFFFIISIETPSIMSLIKYNTFVSK